MTPSIWTDSFVELQPEDAIRRIAGAGWRVMELACKHCKDADGRQQPEAEFKNIRKIADDLGVRIPQMHGPMFNICGDGDAVEKGLAETIRFIGWGAILGVKFFVFHPGSLPSGESGDALDTVRKRNAEVIHRLAEEAAKYGMIIAVENTMDSLKDGRRTFGATVPDLLWILENVGAENVGICWDTGHAHVQQLDQMKSITSLGKHIVATHIADNDTTRDQHLLPFEGSIDWQAVVRALKQIGFEGGFNLEVGGAMHRVPIEVREAKLRYALELAKHLIETF